MVMSTVVSCINCSDGAWWHRPSERRCDRHARCASSRPSTPRVRPGSRPAYLSRLENDAVKKPSPHVLHQLSEALGVPYADLMRLSGYRVPGESRGATALPSARRSSPISPRTSAKSSSSTSPGIAPGADQGRACVAGGDTVGRGSTTALATRSLALSASLRWRSWPRLGRATRVPEPPRRPRIRRPRPRSGCPSAASRPANARRFAARGRIPRPGARDGGPPGTRRAWPGGWRVAARRGEAVTRPRPDRRRRAAGGQGRAARSAASAGCVQPCAQGGDPAGGVIANIRRRRPPFSRSSTTRPRPASRAGSL